MPLIDATGLALPLKLVARVVSSTTLATLRTVEHGCEYGETLFLSGSMNCKDFVKHLILGLIQHLAPLVLQSKKEWQLGKAKPS